jgi:hypothetical protein
MRRRRRVCSAVVVVATAAGLTVSSGGSVALGSPAADGSLRSSAERGAALAPPKCSAAGTAAVMTAWLPGHLVEEVQAPVGAAGKGHAMYTRWCGPATILARLHGATYRIPGGRCELGRGYLVRAGLIDRLATRGQWVGLFLHDARAEHPGTFKLAEGVYASAELRGRNLAIASHGTITVGQSMRNGTFALRLSDGTPLTGSWTCG